MKKNNKDINHHPIVLADATKTSRRKVVKNLVFGVSALAAYSALPTKWGTPIIEQVFLPAHAATSGLVNGTFRGTVGAALTSTERNFGEYIAQIGDSIGNLFVSDAHAGVEPGFGSWCVSLAGGNATFTGALPGVILRLDRIAKMDCIEITGSVTGPITHISGIVTYVFEVMSESEQSITVQITTRVGDSTVTGTGTLTRSDTPCVCEEAT